MNKFILKVTKLYIWVTKFHIREIKLLYIIYLPLEIIYTS